MNKPLRMPQLSAAKQRTGLRSFGELIEVLIRQYELQNAIEETRERRESHQRNSAPTRQRSNSSTLVQPMAPVRQATFAFYEGDLV
jgi:elongation factor P--beta-lysine ligase